MQILISMDMKQQLYLIAIHLQSIEHCIKQDILIKKTTTYKEQKPEEVKIYRENLKNYDEYQKIYIDETSIEIDLVRDKGWVKKMLLPALTKKSVIILDNATFHRRKKLREEAEKFGHKVLPLPPYSPELNPIEKTQANLKKFLQKISNFCKDIKKGIYLYLESNQL